MGYRYTMEYYSALKKAWAMRTLHEISQSQNTKRSNDPTYEAPRGVKLPESERRMTAAGAEMGQKGRC